MQGVFLFLVSALTGSVFDAGYNCAQFAIETQAPSVSASSPTRQGRTSEFIPYIRPRVRSSKVDFL